MDGFISKEVRSAVLSRHRLCEELRLEDLRRPIWPQSEGLVTAQRNWVLVSVSGLDGPSFDPISGRWSPGRGPGHGGLSPRAAGGEAVALSGCNQ